MGDVSSKAAFCDAKRSLELHYTSNGASVRHLGGKNGLFESVVGLGSSLLFFSCLSLLFRRFFGILGLLSCVIILTLLVFLCFTAKEATQLVSL